MRDLDSRARELMQNIDRQASVYLTNVRTMGSDKRKDQMDKIQEQFNKAKEYGDDKVQLAIQTYELVCVFFKIILLVITYFVFLSKVYQCCFIVFQVDKHIRRLDSDLARFETEIHDKAASNTRSQEEASSQKSKIIGFLFICNFTFDTNF